MVDRPLHAHIKNPVILTISDGKNDFHSGCKVIDINFPNITNPEVGEIHFKNSYTALITIKAKLKIPENGESVAGGDSKWKTCVRRFRLMPNPHMEEGSQEYFCVGKKQFMIELSNVIAIRVILQQPSPVWKDFRIEDLKLYRSSEMNKPPPLPSWLTEDSGKTKKSDLTNRSSGNIYNCPIENCFLKLKLFIKVKYERIFVYYCVPQKNAGKAVPNLESISSCLQHLWALAEEVGARQTEKALGRYEVDGCYEINLLSYT